MPSSWMGETPAWRGQPLPGPRRVRLQLDSTRLSMLFHIPRGRHCPLYSLRLRRPLASLGWMFPMGWQKALHSGQSQPSPSGSWGRGRDPPTTTPQPAPPGRLERAQVMTAVMWPFGDDQLGPSQSWKEEKFFPVSEMFSTFMSLYRQPLGQAGAPAFGRSWICTGATECQHLAECLAPNKQWVVLEQKSLQRERQA